MPPRKAVRERAPSGHQPAQRSFAAIKNQSFVKPVTLKRLTPYLQRPKIRPPRVNVKGIRAQSVTAPQVLPPTLRRTVASHAALPAEKEEETETHEKQDDDYAVRMQEASDMDYTVGGWTFERHQLALQKKVNKTHGLHSSDYIPSYEEVSQRNADFQDVSGRLYYLVNKHSFAKFYEQCEQYQLIQADSSVLIVLLPISLTREAHKAGSTVPLLEFPGEEQKELELYRALFKKPQGITNEKVQQLANEVLKPAPGQTYGFLMTERSFPPKKATGYVAVKMLWMPPPPPTPPPPPPSTKPQTLATAVAAAAAASSSETKDTKSE